MKRVTVTEAEARYYFTQIAAGIKFLSDIEILHRYIKLANLFLAADMTDGQDWRFRPGHSVC